jgi:Protein of unknown function (DUF760)
VLSSQHMHLRYALHTTPCARRSSSPLHPPAPMPQPDSQGDRKRAALIAYVDGLTVSGTSAVDCPAAVTSAMRQTVSNLIGTLPPQYFEVTITSRSEHIAQLLFTVLMYAQNLHLSSIMCGCRSRRFHASILKIQPHPRLSSMRYRTGYMFHSAWIRLELTKFSALSAESSAHPPSDLLDVAGTVDDVTYLSLGPGTTSAPPEATSVSGEVVRWYGGQPTKLGAAEYIEQLESELGMLRRQIVSLASIADNRAHGNELLDYLKGLTAPQLQDLSTASPEVLHAMDCLVKRLQGVTKMHAGWVV